MRAETLFHSTFPIFLLWYILSKLLSNFKRQLTAACTKSAAILANNVPTALRCQLSTKSNLWVYYYVWNYSMYTAWINSALETIITPGEKIPLVTDAGLVRGTRCCFPSTPFNDLLWLSSSNIIKPATVWEAWFESVAYLIAYLCSPTKILSPNRNLLTCPEHRLGKGKDIEVASGGRPQKAT